MGKGKRRKEPTRAEQKDIEPQTEEKVDLVPPARRPPTAVATGTPPPPAPRRAPVSTPQRRRPALFHLVQALRLAAGAVIDLADAAADAITRQIEGRRGTS